MNFKKSIFEEVIIIHEYKRKSNFLSSSGELRITDFYWEEHIQVEKIMKTV